MDFQEGLLSELGSSRNARPIWRPENIANIDYIFATSKLMARIRWKAIEMRAGPRQKIDCIQNLQLFAPGRLGYQIYAIILFFADLIFFFFGKMGLRISPISIRFPRHGGLKDIGGLFAHSPSQGLLAVRVASAGARGGGFAASYVVGVSAVAGSADAEARRSHTLHIKQLGVLRFMHVAVKYSPSYCRPY